MDLLKANMVKVVRKKAAGSLVAGEEVLAAFLAQDEGSFHRQALALGTARGMGGALGAAAGTAMMGRGDGQATGDEAEGDAGLAGRFPTGPVVVAFTDQRVLAFGRGSMADRNPGSLLAEWPAGQVVRAERGGSKLGKVPVTLGFADGSAVTVDAGSMQRWDEVDAAIAAAAG